GSGTRLWRSAGDYGDHHSRMSDRWQTVCGEEQKGAQGSAIIRFSARSFSEASSRADCRLSASGERRRAQVPFTGRTVIWSPWRAKKELRRKQQDAEAAELDVGLVRRRL